jgi:hypothetical protein
VVLLGDVGVAAAAAVAASGGKSNRYNLRMKSTEMMLVVGMCTLLVLLTGAAPQVVQFSRYPPAIISSCEAAGPIW